MVSAASKKSDRPDGHAVPSRPGWWARYRLLVLLAGVSIVVDQLTKAWAVRDLRPIGLKRLWPGVVDFQFSLNPGAAWSLLANAEPGFRRWFFLLVTVVAIGLIVTLYRKARTDQSLLRGALCLLLGGAVGNLIDRVREGQVVDFIALRFIEWPIFNVADIVLVIGVVLLGFDLLKSRKAAPQPVQNEGAPVKRRRKKK